MNSRTSFSLLVHCLVRVYTQGGEKSINISQFFRRVPAPLLPPPATSPALRFDAPALRKCNPWDKDYASHCSSSVRCATTSPAGALFDALSFPGWVAARMLVQAIVLAVVGVTANQAVPVPYLDSLWADVKHCRHLLDGQHARLA